jgi:hypothetical protein
MYNVMPMWSTMVSINPLKNYLTYTTFLKILLQSFAILRITVVQKIYNYELA